MDLAVKESAGGQHHRPRSEANAHLRYGPHHTVTFDHKVVDRLLKKPEARLVFQAPANRRLVQHPISLSPGGSHRRAFAGIENAKLYARLIGGQGHGAAQGIDLFDQMPLADTADRGVATHLPKGLDVVGQQQGGAAHARSGQRRLGAGMAATDDDHIKFLGVGIGQHMEVLGAQPKRAGASRA